MVLRFGTEVLEDALLPESFHVVPILDETMTDGLIDLVGFSVGIGFVADEEVEVFDAAFGRKRRGRRKSSGLGRN